MRIFSGWSDGPIARVRGTVATDHCFRVFLHLHGGLGWGRDARFDMRIAPWQKYVTVSCPGHRVPSRYLEHLFWFSAVDSAVKDGIGATDHCFRVFLTSMRVLGRIEMLSLT